MRVLIAVLGVMVVHVQSTDFIVTVNKWLQSNFAGTKATYTAWQKGDNGVAMCLRGPNKELDKIDEKALSKFLDEHPKEYKKTMEYFRNLFFGQDYLLDTAIYKLDQVKDLILKIQRKSVELCGMSADIPKEDGLSLSNLGYVIGGTKGFVFYDGQEQALRKCAKDPRISVEFKLDWYLLPSKLKDPETLQLYKQRYEAVSEMHKVVDGYFRNFDGERTEGGDMLLEHIGKRPEDMDKFFEELEEEMEKLKTVIRVLNKLQGRKTQ